MTFQDIAVLRCRWVFVFVILWATVIPWAVTAQAVEKDRLWVDAEGKFTVEARLVEVAGDVVKLRRIDDHEIITVRKNWLSDIDKKYLEEAATRMSERNPLRFEPPTIVEIKPLPWFRMPGGDDAAQQRVPDGSSIAWDESSLVTSELDELPSSITADASPTKYEIPQAVLPIFTIHSMQNVSDPIPFSTVTEGGEESTSVAVSISARYGYASRAVAQPPLLSPSRIVRFSPGDSKAFTAFQSDEPLRLLDHHQQSQKSLAIMGKPSRKRIGELVILEGWEKRSLKITRRLSLDIPSKLGQVSKVSEGFFVDERHALLKINRSVGLWNLDTGKCVYRVNGLDPRCHVAISGGRRYFAVPFDGGVDIRRTDTGEPLGKILVESQTPGVSFSHDGSKLAIVTSKRLRVWDLTAAALSADVSTRRSFGTEAPVWVDSDFVLTGSGLLVSLFRAMPVWRYELGTDRIAAVGKHVVVFRKNPVGELSVLTMPHGDAAEKIRQIDSGEIEVDRETWRIAEQSRWKSGRWVE